MSGRHCIKIKWLSVDVIWKKSPGLKGGKFFFKPFLVQISFFFTEEDKEYSGTSVGELIKMKL